jgi:hypothetical protein
MEGESSAVFALLVVKIRFLLSNRVETQLARCDARPYSYDVKSRNGLRNEGCVLGSRATIGTKKRGKIRKSRLLYLELACSNGGLMSLKLAMRRR